MQILMGLFYMMAVEGRLAGELGTFQVVVEAVVVAPKAMEVVPYVDFFLLEGSVGVNNYGEW